MFLGMNLHPADLAHSRTTTDADIRLFDEHPSHHLPHLASVGEPLAGEANHVTVSSDAHNETIG